VIVKRKGHIAVVVLTATIKDVGAIDALLVILTHVNVIYVIHVIIIRVNVIADHVIIIPANVSTVICAVQTLVFVPIVVHVANILVFV
jgi:hypothetical protein